MRQWDTHRDVVSRPSRQASQQNAGDGPGLATYSVVLCNLMHNMTTCANSEGSKFMLSSLNNTVSNLQPQGPEGEHTLFPQRWPRPRKGLGKLRRYRLRRLRVRGFGGGVESRMVVARIRHNQNQCRLTRRRLMRVWPRGTRRHYSGPLIGFIRIVSA